MNKINVKYLVEVCGGSKDIIEEMADIFFEQIPEFYNEMDKLFAARDYNGLGMLAHKAKSSVAIMGMDHLAARLKELELKAKSGEESDSYQEYIDEFKSETAIAIEELKDYIHNI